MKKKFQNAKLFFKEKGFLPLILKIFNFFLKRFINKTLLIYLQKSDYKFQKIFLNRQITLSDDQNYYYLDPIPSSKELDDYYSNSYWDVFPTKIKGLSYRDIVHFNILKEYMINKIIKNNTFLNFGAGHGGLSHLMWSNNMHVINIEPSGLPNFYNNRWKTLQNIDQVETNSIDILYGSHSLEHVQNLENFKKEVKRVLKSDGYLFWEVPNAEKTEGDKEYPDIVIPHTFYFKKSFFKAWFSKTLLCETYNKLHNYNLENYCNVINNNGKIIRAIGQL